MTIEESVPLSGHTTFRIGGPAALFITIEDTQELPAACAYAEERGLALYPLGEGSNVLADDGEIRKAILHLSTRHIAYEEAGDHVLVTADGGVRWDTLVEETALRGLWGLENLAAIPGTVGAAPVQNIGAYGREVMDVIERVEAYDPAQNEFVSFQKEECGFSYRDSRFKREPGRIITRVTFRLSVAPDPKLGYADIAARQEAGAELSTPADIAREIRAIRSRKFPDMSVYGTAGSFFKNPVITAEHYEALNARYPELKGFRAEGGIKIPIAWILDHALSLRGHARGPVHVYENHALVLVAEQGATARDVDALANDVASRVHAVSNIDVEREVQALQ